MRAALVAWSIAACGNVSGDPIVAGARDTDGAADGGVASTIDGGSSVDGALPPTAEGGPRPAFVPPCPADQWCWASPRPTGDDFVGVFEGSDGQSAWAVTETGTVLRASPAASGKWTIAYQPASDIVATDMFGLDETHVWVTYGGYLGKDQSSVGAMQLAPYGGALGWDGSQWRVWSSSSAPVVAVWSASANEVWVITPTLIEVLDASLRETTFFYGVHDALGADLVSVNGSGPDDVRVIASNGSTAHWDAKRPLSPGGGDASHWTIEQLPGNFPGVTNQPRRFAGAWTTPPNAWHVATADVGGANPNHFSVFGLDPTGWASEAEADAPQQCQPSVTTHRLGLGRRAIADTQSGSLAEVLVVVEGSACGWYGLGGAYGSAPLPFPVRALGIAQVRPGSNPLFDVWAMGVGGQTSHTSVEGFCCNELYDGLNPAHDGWPAADAAPRVPLGAVSVDRDGNVWAISGTSSGGGPSDVYRLDGSGVTRKAFEDGENLTAIAAVAPDDVWLGREGGPGSQPSPLLHFDGRDWNDSNILQTAPGASYVTSLSAVGPSDVWAVIGEPYALYHYDGKSWAARDPGFESGVVSAVDAADVWVSGRSGDSQSGYKSRVARWSGAAFEDRSAGLSVGSIYITRLLAVGPDEAWALAELQSPWLPHLMHFTAGQWQPAAVPDPEGSGVVLEAMAARGPNDVWFVGMRGHGGSIGAASGYERGVALHWDGTTFATPVQGQPSVELRAAARGPDGTLWAAGVGGALVYGSP
jgi:hypothetical protein